MNIGVDIESSINIQQFKNNYKKKKRRRRRTKKRKRKKKVILKRFSGRGA